MLHRFNPRSISTYMVVFGTWIWAQIHPDLLIPAEIAAAITGLLAELLSALIPDDVEDTNGTTQVTK